MKNIQTLDKHNGYKLIKDSTFPDMVLFCILDPNKFILGQSKDEQAVKSAWEKAKNAGGVK